MAEVTYNNTPRYNTHVFGDRKVFLNNITGGSGDTVTLPWQRVDIVTFGKRGGTVPTDYAVASTYVNNTPKSVVTLTGASVACDIEIVGY